MGFFFSQVAAIAETPEYRMGIRKNAKMDEGIYIYVTFRTFFFHVQPKKVQLYIHELC